MLEHGLAPVVRPDGKRQYHSAVIAVVIINEPELKVADHGSTAVGRSQGLYTRAILSALDGCLDAERELGVLPNENGDLPPFSVTYSFAMCNECKSSAAGNRLAQGAPGLAQMYDVLLAGLSASIPVEERPVYSPLGKYVPRNDLRAAMQDRWAMGFNTQNRVGELCPLILEKYGASPLRDIPLYIGEYHDFRESAIDLESDLRTLNGYMQQSPCGDGGPSLAGVSVFEFQTSYYKGTGDGQDKFGIFDLGSTKLGNITPSEGDGWQEHDVWCIRPRGAHPAAVAAAFGGSVPGHSACPEAGSFVFKNSSHWRPSMLV